MDFVSGMDIQVVMDGVDKKVYFTTETEAVTFYKSF